jgi:ATP synthase F1 gamma subunit
MSTISTQKHIIEDVSSVKYITSALRDISAIELKGLRDTFERNGMFYEELQFLYQLVWRLAADAGRDVLLERKEEKVVHVAYTTNRHFYGSLNNDVMDLFTKSTGTKDTCIIIGTTGAEVWRTARKKRKKVTFMEFKDDAPNKEEEQNFLDTVGDYGRIFIYYPHFNSVYEQRADMRDITFRPTKEQLKEQEANELPQYFLEPDLAEMLTFFNSQVRYVLFQRMLLETQLSRVAARLVRMDMADHNARDVLAAEHRELNRAYRSFFSSRMLETLTGFVQWHKKST